MLLPLSVGVSYTWYPRTPVYPASFPPTVLFSRRGLSREPLRIANCHLCAASSGQWLVRKRAIPPFFSIHCLLPPLLVFQPELDNRPIAALGYILVIKGLTGFTGNVLVDNYLCKKSQAVFQILFFSFLGGLLSVLGGLLPLVKELDNRENRPEKA